jgi:NADPH-dependent 2,4-dienoyl-CoA reductase/sulfur reductase-like enzyme
VPAVPDRVDVAVVGAGPYGLSVGAHLRGRTARTFGEPMETWRTRMPPDMLLRSDWDETSLSAPGDHGSIDRWAAAAGEPREEPIPLQKFLRYADWFERTFAPEGDPSRVAHLEPAPGGYRVITADGSEVDARVVVVAVGAIPFAYAPPPLADAIGEDVTYATEPHDYGSYAGKRVVVIGGGQGGLESAALAAREGADVELIVRSAVRWFADREPHRVRGPMHRRLYRLAYPVVGYGPPPLNRLALSPDTFARLPGQMRRRAASRVLRSGGSPWLRPMIERTVRVTEGRAVTGLDRRDGEVRVRLSDGSERAADAVVVAAGFRFSLERLSFLAPQVVERIELVEGWPRLDRWFQSTAVGLHFVGFAAEHRFGPIARFIPGTRFTATRVREAIDR